VDLYPCFDGNKKLYFLCGEHSAIQGHLNKALLRTLEVLGGIDHEDQYTQEAETKEEEPAQTSVAPDAESKPAAEETECEATSS
jgi:hypothetical protein